MKKKLSYVVLSVLGVFMLTRAVAMTDQLHGVLAGHDHETYSCNRCPLIVDCYGCSPEFYFSTVAGKLSYCMQKQATNIPRFHLEKNALYDIRMTFIAGDHKNRKVYFSYDTSYDPAQPGDEAWSITMSALQRLENNESLQQAKNIDYSKNPLECEIKH